VAGESGASGATGAVRSPFEGELIRLRAIEDADIEWVNDHFWNANVTRFLDIVWPEPVEGTRAFVERSRASEDSLALLIETRAGERAGVCSLDGALARTRTADFGIWLDEQFWSRGLGTDAVRTICRLGFREMNLQRITLHVYDFNERGRRAYEKVGFREEGRLRRDQFVDGHPVDVVIMGLLAEELVES
jgi:RimJ/RimL family protein N-acetyltransferase